MQEILVDTLVRITVTRLDPPVGGKKYGLTHFPRRSGDTTIYHTDPLVAEETPHLPREVRWEVEGLQPGQRVVIKEKLDSGAKGRISGVEIPHGTKEKHSGKARPPAPRASSREPAPKRERWSYDVFLMDGSSEVAKPLDPDIIIIEEP